ncbi:two-pore potassium channel 1-like isoform X1 [Cucurbita moschata]|uniref:Two-pore potassium channel 1-like isoform X1 n=1 Tax=Cucurbita moschata TaxID=3662 RepID=A0A6J1EHP4_CUCMO|nr:two-pore potassium channel 1-like isoform X1 [Cucurbita moschata]XP_022925344.1 two-pore potassium channel 1-like isoform X1 [Cucurbita moschata]XP_022925345.1 two-pore potassium channel 1-like isoform X1 [Cucurbita moschata]
MESGDVEQSLLPKLSDSKKSNSLQRRKSIHHEIFSRSLEHNNQPRNGDETSHQRVIVKQVSFRKVFVVLAIYLGGGTLCFFLVGDQINGKKTNGIVDAIYFCVVTMTTVGYGDLVPNSIGAKLLACAYVFTGITLGGMLLSRAANYIVEKQEIHLVKAIFMSKKISSGELLRESVAHKLKYKIIMTGIVLWVLVVVGILFLILVEKFEFTDAFYCVCSTITTLGYGDKSFSTTTGRVFAVIWIMSSTICLAQFFLYLAELRAERRQKSLVNRVLSRDLTFSDLEEADLDHDKVVSAAEFVVYKLKEMGKINQEDVSPILDTFYKLDIDQSGNLTEADLVTS